VLLEFRGCSGDLVRGMAVTKSAAGTPAEPGLMQTLLIGFVLYCLFHWGFKASRGTFVGLSLALSGNEYCSFRGRQAFYGECFVRWVEAVAERLEAHPVSAALFIDRSNTDVNDTAVDKATSL